MNTRVDAFIRINPHWADEFNYLRNILLENNFFETLKWGKPTYQYQGKNVILLHAFKDYIAILFLEGSSLQDPNSLLTQQTPNTILPRQFRFQNLSEIKKQLPQVQEFINQTLELPPNLVRAKPASQLEFNSAIKKELEATQGLLGAFLNLSPGKQRGYLLHFSNAVKAETLAARVKKASAAIFAGKPFNQKG